jgi:ribosomal protein L11 methyltransferase
VHDAGKIPRGVIPIRIEAGMAFGTGHHETTALCLKAISTIVMAGLRAGHPSRERPRAQKIHIGAPTRAGWVAGSSPAMTKMRILDLGCGTGVLAIAAAKLWKTRVLATDIDPDAIEVTDDNARINDVAPLVQAVVADGMDHPAIRAAAPFDLIVANILAQPLTRLAPGVASALAPGGMAVLSGLLHWQEKTVLGFYRSQGMVLKRSLRDGPWSALILERPARKR